MSPKRSDLLTTAEAAEMLRVSPETVARWVRLGQLEAIRLPSGHIRIRREDVEKLLKREGEDTNPDR
jgi:excisionase family DNA binding protein